MVPPDAPRTPCGRDKRSVLYLVTLIGGIREVKLELTWQEVRRRSYRSGHEAHGPDDKALHGRDREHGDQRAFGPRPDQAPPIGMAKAGATKPVPVLAAQLRSFEGI